MNNTVSVTVSILCTVDLASAPITFDRNCPTLAQAYEAISAAMRKNSIMYPNMADSLSNYMRALVDMFDGKIDSFVTGAGDIRVIRNDA